MYRCTIYKICLVVLYISINLCVNAEDLTWNSKTCAKIRDGIDHYKPSDEDVLLGDDLLMQAIICWHNKYREGLAKPTYLKYDNGLARDAGKASILKVNDGCQREVEHEGEAVFMQQLDRKYFGDDDWAAALQNNGKKLFDFLDTLLVEQSGKVLYNGANICNSKKKYDTVEYDQMLSPKTTHVGCWRSRCPFEGNNRFYIYCFYSPKLQGDMLAGWSDKDVAKMRGSNSPLPANARPAVCKDYTLTETEPSIPDDDDSPGDDDDNPIASGGGNATKGVDGSNSFNFKDSFFIALPVAAIIIMMG